MTAPATVTDQLLERFPGLVVQETADGIPTVWADRNTDRKSVV